MMQEDQIEFMDTGGLCFLLIPINTEAEVVARPVLAVAIEREAVLPVMIPDKSQEIMEVFKAVVLQERLKVAEGKAIPVMLNLQGGFIPAQGQWTLMMGPVPQAP
jgi:hypothetical protein